jgi:hypothetical protein
MKNGQKVSCKMSSTCYMREPAADGWLDMPLNIDWLEMEPILVFGTYLA